jgi:predicted acetyltransferase
LNTKILGYDEVDGQQVLELNIKAFSWFLSPQQMETIRSVDRRVPEYVALYAVEDNEVQSQVGVVILDTQCTHGTEKVGYIWGVATRPSHSRAGYATRLMEEVHKRLTDEGIRYCFLGTGKSLVAYDLYRKLGYQDFTILRRGLKRSQTKGKDKITFKPEEDNYVVVDIFREHSKNLLGFVRRPQNFLEVRKAWSWMPFDMVGVFCKGDAPMGYVIATTEGKLLKIRELCTRKPEDVKECIDTLESNTEFEHLMLDCIIGTHGVQPFVDSGFKLFSESWGILMIKDLKEEGSLSDIKTSYGIEQGKFHMTSIDEY